jgi:NADPH:quinone reductase-like Zn-dependent oxidoreductase
VQVEATAVNPVDTFIRSGAYRTPLPFPFVVGRDLVGTVSELGSDALGFRLGERVWCNSLGHGGRQGAAAQYALVASERLYRLPDGIDATAAVAVLHPAATAHLALITHGGLTAGQTVYIAGGAGHVGTAAILLAVRAGARVITSAAAADLEHCRSLGAQAVFDYRDPELKRLIGGSAREGVDVYLDTSGHQDLQVAVELLAPRGRIVVIAARRADVSLPVRAFYQRDASAIGFVISNATVAELAAAARRINQLLQDGSLVPRAVESLPLKQAAEAHRRLQAGEARSRRLVLHPPTASA